MISRIGVVSKPGRAELPSLLRLLADWCSSRRIDLAADTASAHYMERTDGFPRGELPGGCDLIVVLGGDGTLLSAARAVGVRQIPLLAVNLGGLGFMMTTGPEELSTALESVYRAEFCLDSRMVLETRLIRQGTEVDRFFALNDIVVSNGPVARLLHLEAFASGHYVCSYRADGLILSTPTGSTAYSLSAGGPVMAPDVAAISLTPICPHTLSNRSVVLSADVRVEIRVSAGGEENYLSVDGQVGRRLMAGDAICASKASHTVDIIQTKSVRYFDVLRSKMRWEGQATDESGFRRGLEPDDRS